MDAEPNAASEALSEPGSPKHASKLVTEISSGREMSMEEFDRALGLHTALEVILECHRINPFCLRALKCVIGKLSAVLYKCPMDCSGHMAASAAIEMGSQHLMWDLQAARKKFREDGINRSASGSSEGSGPARTWDSPQRPPLL